MNNMVESVSTMVDNFYMDDEFGEPGSSE